MLNGYPIVTKMRLFRSSKTPSDVVFVVMSLDASCMSLEGLRGRQSSFLFFFVLFLLMPFPGERGTGVSGALKGFLDDSGIISGQLDSFVFIFTFLFEQPLGGC